MNSQTKQNKSTSNTFPLIQRYGKRLHRQPFSGFTKVTDPMTSIHILQAQTGWLAVDKPCNISVHNDPGKDLVSVIADQIKSDANLSGSLGATSGFTVHPVHRLDQETSGVILLATDKTILAQMSDLFALGLVKKQYMALVHGLVAPVPPDPGYGAWTYPLTKTAGGRTNPRGSGPLVACETRYRLVDQSLHYSLLQIDLITGRKHQIRRHAKLAGHPVTGDTRYGSARSLAFLKNNCAYTRLGLHCLSMELTLPGQTRPIHIQSDRSLTQMTRLLETDKIA
jgi:23S rRNA-/tRNA-specific pseudouridylate synthase